MASDRRTGLESGSAAFKDHFSSVSAAYAAHRPIYPRALANYLASLVPEPRLAWEAGCGSGQLTLLLAERFERVIATDASADQLARAPRQANVEYQCARAEQSGIADASIDLAVVAQAVHWFDLERYYADVRRVCRPHGIVALACYDTFSSEPKIDAIVDPFYRQVLAPYWPLERKHVESLYRSLAFPFEEVETPELAMVMNWSFDQLMGYIQTWSAVQALCRAGHSAALDTFRAELATAWGPAAHSRPLHCAIGLRVGRVTSKAII